MIKRWFNINNPEYFLLLFLGIFYYIFVLYDNHFGLEYNNQYFLYDYHFGFIKRGLIGALLNYLPLKITQQVFISLSTLLIFVLGIFVTLIIDKISFRNKIFGYFLVSLLVISPALLKNLWYDLGKFDIFGILYCTLLVYPFKKRINDVLFLLSPFILIVHEGFFLLWLPTYFVCWLIRNDLKLNKNIFYLFIITSCVILFLILKFARTDIDLNLFKAYLKSKTPDTIEFENTIVTKDTRMLPSLKANFTRIKFWLLGFVNLFSMIYIIYLICKLLHINFLRYKVIFIPLFFSFLMFLLGSDCLRWFSNMCFSLYLTFISILINNKTKENDDLSFNNSDMAFLIFLLLLMLPFNRLGVLWW